MRASTARKIEPGAGAQRPVGPRLAALLAAIACAFLLVFDAHAKEKKSKEKGAAQQAAEEIPNTWYTSTVARHDAGVMVVNYWSKGPFFRAETIVAGKRISSLVNGDRYYIFDSVSGTGLSIQRSEKAVLEDATRGRPFGREYDQVIAGGGEKIRGGSFPQAGVDYEIYQLTDENGRRQVLVTKDDPHLPIRIETFVRSAGQRSYIEYQGWQRGIPIADSFFEPPANIKFQKVDYDTYVLAVTRTAIGPAPVFYSHLLHGTKD